jgi:hypothetical protein
MRYALFAVLCLACVSCRKDHLFDCLKGTGKVITVERYSGWFHSIEWHDKIDLVFHKGQPKVVLTGGANLLDGIETTVQNGWLILRDHNQCNWVRDFNKRLRVEVFTDSLIRIDNYGSGNFLAADTIECTDFRYDNWQASGKIDLKMKVVRFYMNIHTGTADVNGSGKAEVQILYYNGYGRMNLKPLAGYLIYVNNSGSNDMIVSVRDELHAKIEESGNIYYSGNPAIIVPQITGTGQLIPLP